MHRHDGDHQTLKVLNQVVEAPEALGIPDRESRLVHVACARSGDWATDVKAHRLLLALFDINQGANFCCCERYVLVTQHNFEFLSKNVMQNSAIKRNELERGGVLVRERADLEKCGALQPYIQSQKRVCRESAYVCDEDQPDDPRHRASAKASRLPL